MRTVVILLLSTVLAAGCTGTDGRDPGAGTETGAEASNPGSVVDATSDVVEADVERGDELVWTVIAVAADDHLNVRAAPDPEAEVVDTIDPWTTDLVVRADTARTADGARWRYVETASGVTGWVNSRFLVAQPGELTTTAAEQLATETDAFIEWVLTGAEADEQRWLADRALWVGGIGVYADLATPWTWIPGSELNTPDGWRVIRDFSPASLGPCPDCDRSLLEFLRLSRIDETTRTLVDDVAPASSAGVLEGLLWQAPDTLHRVVLDTPSTTFLDDDGNPQPTLDWQRIHVVFDWSDGNPRVALLHTHGWTP